MSIKGIPPIISAGLAIVAQILGLPTWLKVTSGMIFFLVAIVWGWIERRNRNSFVRALAIVSIHVGAVGFCCLALITAVLLSQTSPLAMGTIIHKESENFRIDQYSPPDRLVGTHTLAIAYPADTLEVIFAPAPNDRNRVLSVRVANIRPLSLDPSKVVRSDPKEDGVLFRRPGSSPSANVDISVALAESKSISLEIVAEYKYGRKDLWWRIQKWIFERYS